MCGETQVWGGHTVTIGLGHQNWGKDGVNKWVRVVEQDFTCNIRCVANLFCCSCYIPYT